MSALHHDVSWPGIKAGLTTEVVDNRRFYKPVDQRQRFTLAQFAILAAEVMEQIKNGAAAHIKGVKPGATPMFRVNPIRSLDACEKNTLELFQTQNVKHVLIYRMTGVDFNQQLACTKRAIALVREFFAPPEETIFNLEDGKESLQDWALDETVKIANFGYQKAGFIRSDAPISWKQEELEFFGVHQSNINPERISCVQYALLRARIAQAKDMIFAPPNDQIIYEIKDYLQKWGCRRVNELDIGDLVLYYSNGKPSHLGYFVGDGLVESKLGLMNSHSHQHPIFGVPAPYGQHAVFFRPSGAKLL